MGEIEEREDFDGGPTVYRHLQQVAHGDAERRLYEVGGGLGGLLRRPAPVPRAA